MRTNLENTNNPPLSASSDLEQRLLQAIEACEAARQREAVAERRYLQAGRRARLLGGLAIVFVMGTVALSTLKPVGAQGGGNGIPDRVAALETKVTSLQASVTTLQSNVQTLQASNQALQNSVQTLQNRVVALEGKTRFMSADANAR